MKQIEPFLIFQLYKNGMPPNLLSLPILKPNSTKQTHLAALLMQESQQVNSHHLHSTSIKLIFIPMFQVVLLILFLSTLKTLILHIPILLFIHFINYGRDQILNGLTLKAPLRRLNAPKCKFAQ